ncbi:MAG: class II aldolase/adducin family protein [Actinomycetota bacterium]
MRYATEREQVRLTALAMFEKGFTEGTSGNVSMRVSEGALITPSSIPYPQITVEDILLLDLEGNVLEGEKPPSVERQVHLEIYKRRSNAGAVIHSHPIISAAFSASRTPLPAFLEEFGVFVGDEIRCAEFGISGTPDVANQVADALGENNAAFMASHGLVTVGKDLDHALLLISRVERAGLTYIYTKMLGGPVPIPDHANDLYKQVFAYLQAH